MRFVFGALCKLTISSITCARRKQKLQKILKASPDQCPPNVRTALSFYVVCLVTGTRTKKIHFRKTYKHRTVYYCLLMKIIPSVNWNTPVWQSSWSGEILNDVVFTTLADVFVCSHLITAAMPLVKHRMFWFYVHFERSVCATALDRTCLLLSFTWACVLVEAIFVLVSRTRPSWNPCSRLAIDYYKVNIEAQCGNADADIWNLFPRFQKFFNSVFRFSCSSNV